MTQNEQLPDIKDILKMPLGNQLGRVHRLWRSAITAAVQSLDMTEARWTAMLHLKILGEGATQQALAHELGLEMPSLSRTLNQLVAQQMLERRPHPTDKRAQCLYFTAEGLVVLDELIKRTIAVRQALYQDLAAADIQQLLQALTLMERNARQLLADVADGAVV